MLFFVAQGGAPYRIQTNGCRVATSTSSLKAKNAEMLHPSALEYRKNVEKMPPGAREYRKYAQMKAPSDSPGPLVGKICLESKIFGFWRAALKRRFED